MVDPERRSVDRIFPYHYSLPNELLNASNESLKENGTAYINLLYNNLSNSEFGRTLILGTNGQDMYYLALDENAIKFGLKKYGSDEITWKTIRYDSP